jgi:hypothetical protein
MPVLPTASICLYKSIYAPIPTELWTDTVRQPERIAGLHALCTAFHAKPLELTAPKHRAQARNLKAPHPFLEFVSQNRTT